MSPLVIGIGNRSRGDDGAGPEVAARVAALGLPGVTVVVQDEPLGLVEHLTTHDEVVVVDAVAPSREPSSEPGGESGGEPNAGPGGVHVWVVGSAPLPRDAHTLGSHGLGVAEAVELARALGRLPRRLTLVGVEAQTLSTGAPLSRQVRGLLDDAVRSVLDTLSATAP